MIQLNIPKIFASDDTIYHYTKTEIALDHILFDKKLKISPRKNSIDPIENSKFFHPYSSNKSEYSILPDAKKLNEYLHNLNKAAKQLSFCMNSKDDLLGDPHPLPLEYYGFTKPRMWDQYANHYKGVCLAFSKEMIEKEIAKNPNFASNDLDYIDYKKIFYRNQISIEIPELEKKGFNKYKTELHQKLIDKFFYKHEDYKGENEYRICSFSDSENDFLSIKDSIVGIIVPDNGLNKHLFDSINSSLKEFENNIDFIVLEFRKSGLFAEVYDDYKRIRKALRVNTEKLFNKSK